MLSVAGPCKGDLASKLLASLPSYRCLCLPIIEGWSTLLASPPPKKRKPPPLSCWLAFLETSLPPSKTTPAVSSSETGSAVIGQGTTFLSMLRKAAPGGRIAPHGCALEMKQLWKDTAAGACWKAGNPTTAAHATQNWSERSSHLATSFHPSWDAGFHIADPRSQPRPLC